MILNESNFPEASTVIDDGGWVVIVTGDGALPLGRSLDHVTRYGLAVFQVIYNGKQNTYTIIASRSGAWTTW